MDAVPEPRGSQQWQLFVNQATVVVFEHLQSLFFKICSFINVFFDRLCKWGQSVRYLSRSIEFYKATENTDVWFSAFHWPSAGVQFQLLQLSPLQLSTVDITDCHSFRLKKLALLLDLFSFWPSPGLD